MKLSTMPVVILMMAFLIGCNEHSPLTGPMTETGQSSGQLGKAGYDVSIDRIIVGPLGVKFHVRGTIPFSLDIKGDVCFVRTFVNLTVNESGNERTWVAIGGSNFSANLDPQQESLESETVDLRSENESITYNGLVTYVIWIQYSVKASGVDVADMMIFDSPRVVNKAVN